MPTSTALQTAANNKAVSTAAKPKTLRDMVNEMLPAVKDALPAVMTPERFTRIAVSALSANPALAATTPASFLGAMMTAAQLGLEPNTPLGQAYLIPYRNHGVQETQFQLGYRGLIQLAYRSGQVTSIQAEEVCENDEFRYELGLEPTLKHVPARKNRGAPVAYYAVWKTKDGATGFAVMSIDDIKEHAQKFSKAGASGPWATNFSEMAKKGLALDTPIPTPMGWTTMEKLRKGSVVFDMNGDKTKVVAISEVKHLPCFRVNFSDGESIVCDNEHRWVAAIGGEKGWTTYTVNELFDAKSNGKGVTVPVTPRIQYGETETIVPDPWLVGYWLGNGRKDGACVSCSCDDSEFVTGRINASGYKVGAIRKDKRSNCVAIGIRDGFKVALRALGILGEKEIPTAYLRATADTRIKLVQGMMDSDGCIDKDRGRAKFCTTNRTIATQFIDLIRSLGEQAHMTSQVARGFGVETILHTVEWMPATFVPVLMPRKAERVRRRKVAPYRSIKSIEKIDSVPTKCIAVESETKTYLAGWNMVPTHNTVLKKALKYAPLASDFVRGVASDDSIRDYAKDTDILDTNSKVIDVEAEPAEQPATPPPAPEQGKSVEEVL